MAVGSSPFSTVRFFLRSGTPGIQLVHPHISLISRFFVFFSNLLVKIPADRPTATLMGDEKVADRTKNADYRRRRFEDCMGSLALPGPQGNFPSVDAAQWPRACGVGQGTGYQAGAALSCASRRPPSRRDGGEVFRLVSGPQVALPGALNWSMRPAGLLIMAIFSRPLASSAGNPPAQGEL